MKVFELSLATSGKDMMVAWHGGATGHDAIYVQSLGPTGRSLGAPHRVTDGQRYAYEPDLQFVDGDALLAWYEKDPATGELTAWLSRLDQRGKSIWRRQLSAKGGYARNPVVQLFGNTVMVAWIETSKGEQPAVWVARLGLDGVSQGAPRKAGVASANTWNLNAAIDGTGTFYVAYDAGLGTKVNELRLLAINAGVIRELALSPDDGFASVYPDIAISETGMAALTWFDEKDGNEEIYLAILPLTDMLSDADIPAMRVTHTPTASTGAYLAWNGQRLALVWCDVSDGQQDLFLQTYAMQEPEGPVHQLTRTTPRSSIPSIQLYAKGFAIAWNEYLSTGLDEHRKIQTSEANVMLIR